MGRCHKPVVAAAVAILTVLALASLPLSVLLKQLSEALKAKDLQRLCADEATADAHRTSLRSFYLTAESSLATAQMLRTALGEASPRPHALEALRTAGEAHKLSRNTLTKLGESAGDLAIAEPRLRRSSRRSLATRRSGG